MLRCATGGGSGRGVAALASVVAAASAMRSPHRGAARAEPEEAGYYGSYQGDRFGGGIGRRLVFPDSEALRRSSRPCLEGTAVARVAAVSESSQSLRRWATESNWRKATKIHKAAYFNRTENLIQEDVLERIRQHYVDNKWSQHPSTPIQAVLFRLEDRGVFQKLCEHTIVKQVPAVVRGVFNEREERCIVDFANKRLGGGWLSYGMVQEEKMFIERFDYGALCAKSLVEMPVDPTREAVASPFSMYQDEAWILKGGVAWAEVDWYGRTPKDAMSKLKLLDPAEDMATAPTVIAMDAIKASFPIYEPVHLNMMLVKAYTGFVAARVDPDVGGIRQIATGSWGCGAFANNERVMFVIQALAANLAHVELNYHILGDGYTLSEAFSFLEEALLKNWTVNQTLGQLAELCASDPKWRTKYIPKGAARAKL